MKYLMIKIKLIIILFSTNYSNYSIKYKICYILIWYWIIIGDDTKNIILNYKKLSNLKFIITKDEEELQRKRNEENENELKEIEERLNIIKNKIEIENKEREINHLLKILYLF